MDGILLKTTHVLSFNSSSWLFPFVKTSSPSQALAVRRFTPLELQQQLIWYVPPKGTLHDTIEFMLINLNNNQPSNSCSTNVTISQRFFNQTFLISTTEDYPSVHTASSTMMLPSTQAVYITSHYLYTALPPLSDSSILYILSNPIENGKLCLLSNQICDSSVAHFTQQHINKQQLLFSPSSKLHSRGDFSGSHH